jgi:hypothetical protein
MANFSTAQLANIQLKAEQMWSDGQQNAAKKAEVEGLKAIINNQTARIAPLEDSSKDNSVTINWIDTSAIVAEVAEDNCTIDGAALDAKPKTYALDIKYKSDFKVNEDALRSTIYSKEEVAAAGIADALRVLDEKMATVALAKADAFAGTNVYPGIGTYATGTTTIPAASYNQTLFAYLAQVSVMNRMRSSYLIDSGTLYQQYLNAQFNAGNGEGKGTNAMFNSMPIYFDLFNMAAAGIANETLMINRGALAFASKVRYGSAPTEYGGNVNQTRYSVASPTLPGVRYEAFYTLDCTGNQISHIWRFESNAGLFLNPEGQATGNTGVLAFNKGA